MKNERIMNQKQRTCLPMSTYPPLRFSPYLFRCICTHFMDWKPRALVRMVKKYLETTDDGPSGRRLREGEKNELDDKQKIGDHAPSGESLELEAWLPGGIPGGGGGTKPGGGIKPGGGPGFIVVGERRGTVSGDKLSRSSQCSNFNSFPSARNILKQN